jgi:hypothetical protein
VAIALAKKVPAEERKKNENPVGKQGEGSYM